MIWAPLPDGALPEELFARIRAIEESADPQQHRTIERTTNLGTVGAVEFETALPRPDSGGQVLTLRSRFAVHRGWLLGVRAMGFLDEPAEATWEELVSSFTLTD